MSGDGLPSRADAGDDGALDRGHVGVAAAARRSYTAAVGSLAAGGAVALAVAQANWVTTASAGVGFSTSFTGSELAPAMVACALASMAGAVAVVATKGLVRRLIGVVLAVVAVVIVAAPLRVLVDPTGASTSSLSLVAGGATAAARPATAAWWWCLLAAAGGVTALCGAALTVLRGSGWPVMAARFESPAGGRARGSAAVDAWTQLDRGQDPTVDGPPEAAFDPAPPPAVDAGPDPQGGPASGVESAGRAVPGVPATGPGTDGRGQIDPAADPGTTSAGPNL